MEQFVKPSASSKEVPDRTGARREGVNNRKVESSTQSERPANAKRSREVIEIDSSSEDEDE